MNLYLWIEFFITLALFPISLYLSYTGIVNYKDTKSGYNLYYIITFALIALTMLFYAPNSLLTEGQDFLAELTLSGGTILLMLAVPTYIEYFHGIYKRIPYVSTLAYLAIGGGFITLFFQPWEIRYQNQFYGYVQITSDLTSICLLIQIFCTLIIMVQTFMVIKKKVNIDHLNATKLLEEDSDMMNNVKNPNNRKRNLKSNKQILNLIFVSYLLGFCLIGMGMFFPGSIWDSFGFLILIAPQAYFFTRDKEIIVYLSTKKVREGTIQLKKDLNSLHQQSVAISKNFEVEIDSLVDFIEKADFILPFRNK